MVQVSEHAQKCAEQELAEATTYRTILERRQALSKIDSGTPQFEILRLHHFWADKLHAAILESTRAATMAVVARMLQLPRELRDEIYKHLWEFDEMHDPNRALLYWWESFGEPWFQKDDDVGKSPWLSIPTMGLRPPYFVDQAFVGPVVAQEMLQCFKDNVGKDLRPVGEKYPVAECGLLDVSLEDFVRKDVFGVGMTMQELTQNLDLRVNFQCDALVDFDECEDINKTNSGISTQGTEDSVQEKEEGDDEEQDYLSSLDDGATAFLDIPATNRVTTYDEHSRCLRVRPRIITLAIRQESHFLDNAFLDMLKLVSRVHRGLKGKGFTVKIQYYSEAIRLKVLLDDEAWQWTNADWTRNMSLKNSFGQANGNSRRPLARGHVWVQLREYLFRDASSSNSGSDT